MIASTQRGRLGTNKLPIFTQDLTPQREGKLLFYQPQSTSFCKRSNEKNQRLKAMCSELIWLGQQKIYGVSYVFQVMRKTGCLFYQYFRALENMTIKQFYLFLSLMMQILEKLHKQNLNLKQLDVRLLQLVINKEMKTVELQILNRNTIYFNEKTSENLVSKRSSKNERQSNINKKNGKYSSFIEKINPKPSTKQDIKIIFQKIIEIQNFLLNKQIFEFSLSKTKEKILSFRLMLSQMIEFAEESEIKIQNIESWLYVLESFAHQRHQVNIEEVKSQTKIALKKIISTNQTNLESFLNHLNSSPNIYLSLQLIQKDEVKSQNDQQYDEFLSHLQIEEKISEHKLVTNMKFPCHFMTK